MKHSISTIPPFEITRGFNARFVHTESMTIAFVEVDAGAELQQPGVPGAYRLFANFISLGK